MNKPVLLTGFEPFREYVVNSSWEASRLVGEQMATNLLAKRLPVDYMSARANLIAHLTDQKPIMCLCTGLGPRFAMEQVARKPVQFSSIQGPDLLEGAWPWPEMQQHMQDAGCAAEVSYDAGEYVCESTYWSLLAFRQQFGYPHYAAFLHVPPLSEIITAEMIATAIGNVIQARLEHRDVRMLMSQVVS